MAKWENGEYIWKSGALTTNYTNNVVIARGNKLAGLVLYVNYTKGTETHIELQVAFENTNRAVGQIGAEEWYTMSSDGWWPVEMPTAMATTITYLDVQPQAYRFTATGKYRLHIPKFPREDAFRIRIKANAAGTGKVYLRYCTNEVSWGGVGQGDE